MHSAIGPVMYSGHGGGDVTESKYSDGVDDGAQLLIIYRHYLALFLLLLSTHCMGSKVEAVTRESYSVLSPSVWIPVLLIVPVALYYFSRSSTPSPSNTVIMVCPTARSCQPWPSRLSKLGVLIH
jgi:hypothetical protein